MSDLAEQQSKAVLNRGRTIIDDDDQGIVPSTQWLEEELLPLKDDLADWLAKILGITVSAATLMDVLDNGVDVCRLAELVQQKSVTWAESKRTSQPSSPVPLIKYKSAAQTGSWFARENIASFIAFCRAIGIREECLFETEDLALHRNARSVVVCLLELARIGYRYGLEPPSLIRMEKDIEREESGETGEKSSNRYAGDKSSSGDTSDKSVNKFKSKSDQADGSGGPKKSKSMQDLDLKINALVSKCKCEPKLCIKEISEGRYTVGGKTVYLRLLKGRHVMVRVGGGWDTLDHYLIKHDACRITEFQRYNNSLASGDKLLHIQGRYKC